MPIIDVGNSTPNDPDLRPRRRRHPSITGALIVIAVGIFLLVVNLYPQLDAMGVLRRYWPVAIILIGVGKVWEAFQYRGAPGRPDDRPTSAMPFVVLLLVVLLCVGMWHEGKVQASLHESQHVDLGDAKDVDANLDMATGKLSIAGGADKLLLADFKYLPSDGQPIVDYSVTDGRGHINISQPNDSHIRMLNSHNNWDLHFSNRVPLDVNMSLGAGEATFDARGMDLRKLDINSGTGTLKVDLSGPRQHDLNVDVKGGVGAGEFELPKDVGVTARVSGGIGDVVAHGLTENDGNYTNAAFGKTPATIYLTIHGGIGEVTLNTAP
jgi:N-terminal domain of toast_rack, DUF2154/Domain of unknown function (DUF5668)